jgi:L-iditol 2-dehydrogenase
MKAFHITGINEFGLKDVSYPTISSDGVLVKMRASGICHSDYLLISGEYVLPFTYPVTPGHEWAGEVVEVGAKVTGFKVGDRVTGECAYGCGQCKMCLSGDPINCHHAAHFGFTDGTDGGADQEFFEVMPRLLHKLPDEVDFLTGSLVEPFTVAYWGFEANTRVDPSDTVLISGGGNIGLCALAVAKGKGCRTIVLEALPLRVAKARSMGADLVLNPLDDTIIEQVKDATSGGADFALETAGVAGSLKNMLDYVRNGGSIGFVGINFDTIAVQLGKIMSKALTIRGTVGSPNIWEKALKFLANSQVDIRQIHTHQFDLADAEEAFRIAKKPDQAIKVVITNEGG